MTKALNSPDVSADRKKRCDAGLTVINSDRKRKSVMTPYNMFRKVQRIKHNGDIEITTQSISKQIKATLFSK